MRVIVTGAGGFLGWYVVDALVKRGDEIQAWIHQSRANEWGGGVRIVAADITDGETTSCLVKSFAPDLIIHLAAQSFPGRSWENPALTYHVNVVGAVHLLEAVRRLKKSARVLVTGSSAEYVEPLDGRPIVESAPTEANSPYGASKLAVDHLVELYLRRYDLDLIRVRPFFLVGPRKTGDVCSDYARRIVAIERGEEHFMRVGALDVVRDIIDVRDGVAGMLRIAEAGGRGELYNVSGGKGVSVGEILNAYRRLAHAPFTVVDDPMLLRPLEQKVKIGDSRKLRALGWQPQYSLEETLGSILDYWRSLRGAPTPG
jgi:GDP-4-dehydro-6-deoxy-D-mannose reductase